MGADLLTRSAARFGAPRLVPGPREDQEAVEFDGVRDGLIIERNPCEGARGFLVEAVFMPAPGGAVEQRFMHVQQYASESRFLLETRVDPNRGWFLDTFVASTGEARVLADPEARHPVNRWYSAALLCTGTEMAHFVDGRLECRAPLVLEPLGAGVTAIGMRANAVSFFKGRIYALRFHLEAPAGVDALAGRLTLHQEVLGCT